MCAALFKQKEIQHPELRLYELGTAVERARHTLYASRFMLYASLLNI
jgi:hypothetical protein